MVRRSDGKGGWWQGYDVPERKEMTVLDALLYIQGEVDPSLSFRYSCHWAVCGSCAMLINGVPRLACRTRLDDARQRIDLAPSPALPARDCEEVVLEPLPNLKVIKDLVVDQTEFFERLRRVRPAFRSIERDPEGERRMSQEEVRTLEDYTSCILCAACYAACPVCATDPDYIGPAALAKLYRLAADPREGRREERLRSADTPDGWPACRFYTNCRRVCPKGVPPDRAIASARRQLRRRV